MEWNNLPALPPLGAAAGVMLLATILVVGAIAGEVIAATTRLPRVVGYTLAGWGTAIAGVGAQVPLRGVAGWVFDLALALLLFEVGARVRLRWFRNNPGLMFTSLLEALAGGLAVYGAMRLLDLPRDVSAACAVLAVPASAAVAGRVALEMGADGQVTQRMKSLTALNTLYGVLALIVLKAVLLGDRTWDWPAALLVMLASTGGALALAGVLAAAIALVARRLDLRNESSVLFLLGLVLLAVSTARWLELSTLLVPLLAGLLLRNTTSRPWVWPRHFGTAGGVLILMLFVYVGSAWSFEVLAAGGLASAVLLLARSLGKAAPVVALAHWSRISWRQSAALAVTLTPLSASALVMLTELWQVLPELGAQVAPIMLTAIVLLELAGPIAVQIALRMVGEISPASPGADSRGEDEEARS